MAENRLPCLDLLKATPGILRGLMTELTEDDARWKPAPERFSVAEVLAHTACRQTSCDPPWFEHDDLPIYQPKQGRRNTSRLARAGRSFDH